MHNKFFSKHGEKVTTDRSVRISEINMFMCSGDGFIRILNSIATDIEQ